MTGPEVLVAIDIAPEVAPPSASPLRRSLARAVRETLADEGVEAGEISLALVGDGRIRALNRDHLGHDRVTDVISFSLNDAGEPPLADVYVGYPQALRQAAELGLPASEELVRLAIHGTLHALGHDHPGEDRCASVFFHRQEALVKRVLAARGGARQNSRASSRAP